MDALDYANGAYLQATQMIDLSAKDRIHNFSAAVLCNI